jgi:hypothetical protein
LRRAVPFLGICALFLLTWIVVQVEQHFFRHRAKLLMDDIQSIELRKISWGEAQTRLQNWRSNSRIDDGCNEHRCSVEITLDEIVYAYISKPNAFKRLDDYFRWRFKLSYDIGPFVRVETVLLDAYIKVGGHPSRVIATVGMRDGVVWSKGFSVSIETYAHNDPDVLWDGYYTLIAASHTVSRFANGVSLQHPNYAIGRPGGCEICVMGWVEFTPYADPADIRRLTQLDLSCLTRWRPCRTQSDIMPVAWAEYVAEGRIEEGQRIEAACSSLIIELLGRDSARITTGKILSYRTLGNSEGYQDGVVRLRVLERLKGTADWKVGEVRNVHVSLGPDQRNAYQELASNQLVRKHSDRHQPRLHQLRPFRDRKRRAPQPESVSALSVEMHFGGHVCLL